VLRSAANQLLDIPTRISDPDADVPRRASEAYFAVWADIQYGSAAVNTIYLQLLGLRYNSTFPDSEIQGFVRERLTKNTDLNNPFASGMITVAQRICWRMHSWHRLTAVSESETL
jgi:hypothetical protein